MKFTLYATRTTKNGEPSLEFNTKVYKAAISHLEEGKKVQITITDEKTLEQLAKIHVLVKEFSSHTGYTFEQSKREIKRITGYYKDEVENGERIRYILSFADASKDELSAIIAQTEAWMYEQGIIAIPKILNY